MSDQYVQPNPPGGPARTIPYRDPAGTEIPKRPVPVERSSGFGAGAMVGAVFIVVAILAAVFYSSRDADVAPVTPAAVVVDPVTSAPAATTADPVAPEAATSTDPAATTEPATGGTTVTPDTATPDATAPDATAPDATAPDATAPDAGTGGTTAPATPPAGTTQP